MELKRPSGLDRFHDRRMHSRPARPDMRNRKGYFVLAWANGKKMLWGAYGSQDEAQRVGMSRTNGNYQVIALDTTDLAEASRILREQGIIDDGLSSNSFRHFVHT